ncbi:lactonase family protein [Nocardia amikacinitolerans]|uniref:lactonase family protein n=1 Tax=Nocardia amikacinitolerans TaxID=756689 RepID=UPI0020A369E1|nr:beta-propeller fold lactonase family protein [Nocardia amikacinitolerans]MCP2288821.1 6-phosphogluconolactonase, cycloisomerase 2 family [Nocardia amikacinitolerans]
MFADTVVRSRRVLLTLSAALALSWLPTLAHAAPAEDAPRYLLVGGTGSSNISVLRVAGDGGLSQVPGSPFGSDTGSLTLELTPDGHRVYTGHVVSGSIIGYDLGADGSLHEIAGSRIDFGEPVIGVTITPDGRRLFATVGGVVTEVRSFDITAAGLLVPTGAPATRVEGVSALSLPVLTPDARTLFVSSFVAGTVAAFAVGADASLSPLGAPLATGERPALPAVTPDGRFLYISNEGTNNVSGYAIAPDGSLSPAPGSPYPTGGTPHGTAITADSRRLYLPASTGGEVDGFAIGADGALTALPGSPYPAPPGTLPGRVVLGPAERQLYVIDTLTVRGASRVHIYDIAADGSIAASGLPAADTGVIFHDGPSAYLTPQ